MKKGKTAKIIGFKTAKVTYGTVDSVNFKSIYLNIQTWVEPKKEVENWERVVLNLSRDIKHTIFNKLDKRIFEENIIVDLDLRPSGISMKKKSFSNLEINFYFRPGVRCTDNHLEFKSKRLKETLKKIAKQIFNENFSKNEYFKLHLTKSTKEKNIIV